MIAYLGPGIGVATIIIVAIILLIILASLVMVLLRPVKQVWRKMTKKDA